MELGLRLLWSNIAGFVTGLIFFLWSVEAQQCLLRYLSIFFRCLRSDWTKKFSISNGFEESLCVHSDDDELYPDGML